ncbi:Gfo/Idh/MocA family oxidoreductase [Kineococcus sp. R8]|uniref:Gfo/Idh/MocA family protein n=1 Tax=Kineococcus siccus TaxID=2696567 RepID=UPI001412DD12|nr:Gfo/Idh/MocA family oxidoreductase [Kineococcus siccus]NAZ80281.1 Gfo/Idh/MocA family oxidoreductase [Kineococcus siccus]
MSDVVRVGLVGGGGITRAHVRGYLTHADRIAVTAVADIDADAAATRAAELGAKAFTDYREMIATGDVDAVDICLPHHLHADAIVAAAEAGKHVLCEKPLCLTPEEAHRVADAVRAGGVTLMCAHNQLFFPSVAKAKEILTSGRLGTVYEVRTTDSFHNDFDPATMGWRASARTSGGGELIDTGYHPTYLLLHLADAEPLEATAMLSTHRLTFMEGEDSAQVLVRFAGGVVGQMTTSWAYDAAPGTEKFSVVGELGSLSGTATSVTYRLRSGQEETFTFAETDSFVDEIGAFATCLQTGTRPIHTEVEGIAVLGVLLAAYEGARTGTIAKVLRL